MTQRTDADQTSRIASDFDTASNWRSTRLLLAKSLSCVGGLGILSSGLVWAQTRTLPGTVAATTIQPTSTAAAPEKSVPKTEKRALAIPAPEKSVPKILPTVNIAPVSIKRELTKPESTSSQRPLAVERVGSVTTPLKTTDVPIQTKPTVPLAKTPAAIDNNSAYIDPTNYSIGATGGSQTPSQVVLMERSTGCKAVLRSGQGMSSGNLCGAAAVPRSISARQPQPGVVSSVSARQSPLAVPRFISGRSDENHPVPGSPTWTNTSGNIATSVAPIPVGSALGNTNGIASEPLPAFKSPIALADVGNVILPRSITLPPRSGLLEYQQLLRPNGQSISSDINTGMLFPLSAPAPVTSIFGWRNSPISGGSSFHAGTDLGAPIGTPVLAAYAGNVVVANYMGGYGLAIVIEHKNPVEQTLYGHLSQIFVQPGQWVEQGTAIGRVGSTGMSTGPHLHFEIRQMTPQGWVATDPGTQIQSAMTQLEQAVRVAQVPQEEAGGASGK